MTSPIYINKASLLNIGAVGFLILIVLLLTACNSSNSDDENEVLSLEQLSSAAYDSGYSWQGDQLADGDVTLAEYDEANRRNRECLKSNGLQPGEQTRSHLDGFEWYYNIEPSNSLDESKNLQIIVDCSVETMMYVEVAMRSWGDWSTDPAVMHSVETCVAEHGFVSDSEFKNYRDLTMYFKADGIGEEVVPDCINDAMNLLYPTETFTISYF